MSQQPQTHSTTERQFDQQPQMGQQTRMGQQTQSVEQDAGPQREASGQVGQSGAVGQPTAGGAQSGIQREAQLEQQPTAGGQQPANQQPIDSRLEEGLTQEMQVALQDLHEAANTAEWCAERCADHGPRMRDCLRLCRDVADIASLNARLVARESTFRPDAIGLFVTAADACARECARHQEKHCQACASTLSRAIQSVRQIRGSLQGQQGIQTQSTRVGGQQTQSGAGEQYGMTTQPAAGGPNQQF